MTGATILIAEISSFGLSLLRGREQNRAPERPFARESWIRSERQLAAHIAPPRARNRLP
jgi:hypothetical protein